MEPMGSGFRAPSPLRGVPGVSSTGLRSLNETTEVWFRGVEACGRVEGSTQHEHLKSSRRTRKQALHRMILQEQVAVSPVWL